MDENDSMSEVEQKLEQALLLKQALKINFFPNNDSAVAYFVENRIKELIRSELEVVMGMKKPEASTELENEELNALKQIAKRLVEKSGGTQSSSAQSVSMEQAPVAPEEDKEIEVTLPNGNVVKTKVRPQVMPEGYRGGSLQDIADQAANQAQFQALNYTPKSGIMGLAVSVANQGLIPQNFISEEEEER